MFMEGFYQIYRRFADSSLIQEKVFRGLKSFFEVVSRALLKV